MQGFHARTGIQVRQIAAHGGGGSFGRVPQLRGPSYHAIGLGRGGELPSRDFDTSFIVVAPKMTW